MSRALVTGATGRDEVVLRAARSGDAAAVAELIHSTAEDVYGRFAGDRESSLRALRAAFRRRGTGASRDVVLVAERRGEVAGAMAAFPATQIDQRSTRFLRLLLRRSPPWTWRETIRMHRLAAAVAPPPPPDSLYVDSLATAPRHRRAGVARALLAEAERRALAEGFPSVALETAAGNHTARMLYEASGFERAAQRPPRGGLPGFVGYVKAL